MHAYAWYVWRKAPRCGPSLKVRIGKSETISALSAVTCEAPHNFMKLVRDLFYPFGEPPRRWPGGKFRTLAVGESKIAEIG
jgi:hypothetical protein